MITRCASIGTIMIGILYSGNHAGVTCLVTVVSCCEGAELPPPSVDHYVSTKVSDFDCAVCLMSETVVLRSVSGSDMKCAYPHC